MRPDALDNVGSFDTRRGKAARAGASTWPDVLAARLLDVVERDNALLAALAPVAAGVRATSDVRRAVVFGLRTDEVDALSAAVPAAAVAAGRTVDADPALARPVAVAAAEAVVGPAVLLTVPNSARPKPEIDGLENLRVSFIEPVTRGSAAPVGRCTPGPIVLGSSFDFPSNASGSSLSFSDVTSDPARDAER